MEGSLDIGHWWGGRDGRDDGIEEAGGRGVIYLEVGGGIEDILGRTFMFG